MIDLRELDWQPYAYEGGPDQARFYFENGWHLSMIRGLDTYEIGIVNPKGFLEKINNKFLVYYATTDDAVQHYARIVSAWASEDDVQEWVDSDDGRLEWR